MRPEVAGGESTIHLVDLFRRAGELGLGIDEALALLKPLPAGVVKGSIDGGRGVTSLTSMAGTAWALRAQARAMSKAAKRLRVVLGNRVRPPDVLVTDTI
jgi:hypothetical protein